MNPTINSRKRSEQREELSGSLDSLMDLRPPKAFTMDSLVAIEKAQVAPLSSITQAAEFGKLVRVRSRGIFRGPAPMLPEEGFDYWCSYILERCLQDYDACVIFTGETGSGKSTLALQAARTVDPEFNLRTDLCYTASALKDIYRQRSENPAASRGRVVVFDEGVRGLLAGDQNTDEQKDTVKMLALVRALNVPLFICVPDIWRLAKPVRENRACLWIHVTRRGRALVHVRRERIQYDKNSDLGFDVATECPWVTWDRFDDNDPFWKLYMVVKMQRLNEYFREKQRSRGKGHTTDAQVEESLRKHATIADLLRDGMSQRQVIKRTGASWDLVSKVNRELKDQAVAAEPVVLSTSTTASAPKRKANAAGLRNWDRREKRKTRTAVLAEGRKQFTRSLGKVHPAGPSL